MFEVREFSDHVPKSNGVHVIQYGAYRLSYSSHFFPFLLQPHTHAHPFRYAMNADCTDFPIPFPLGLSFPRRWRIVRLSLAQRTGHPRLFSERYDTTLRIQNITSSSFVQRDLLPALRGPKIPVMSPRVPACVSVGARLHACVRGITMVAA